MDNLIDEKVIKNFLEETRSLVYLFRKNPESYENILKYISMTKDNSRLLGYVPVFKLIKALEDICKALCDDKINLNENLKTLIEIVCDKISEYCILIEKKNFDSQEFDIKPYLLYCDKAVAGEIYSPKHLLKHIGSKSRIEKKINSIIKKRTQEAPEQELSISSGKIKTILNHHEEMIARTYIINNQIELLKTAIAEKNTHELKEVYKLLASNMQNLQSTLLISHENLISLVQNEDFIKSHQEYQGFFVMANDKKYLIPSEYIVDVVCESPLNYLTVQNQKIIEYSASEDGEELENVPVYSLSSLFPDQKAKNTNILDTILIVSYQGQKVGIIVEAVQKYVSVLKKDMPPAFENFSAVTGVAFDEKYDMIPILHIPEIMKRFRSLRGYDVKKFEAVTRKHLNKILIVDDSETTRQIQHSILYTHNYSVDEAIDGIDAMDKLKSKQFDLILCDDDMPRMNGEILLDNIRRMENYATVPVVAMSEKPLAKANAFVSKSNFTRELLISTIKRMLNDE